MRFNGLALFAGAVVLGACGGGAKNSTDTTATTPAPAATTPAATTPATTTPAPASGVAMAPATGKTWEVKMSGDANGYKFDPANLTIKQGDAVKFIVVSGQPHNIAFDAATVPAAGKDQLNANMPNEMSDLSSPMLLNAHDNYVISFAKVAPGKYDFHCTPHLPMGMKGTITVQ